MHLLLPNALFPGPASLAPAAAHPGQRGTTPAPTRQELDQALLECPAQAPQAEPEEANGNAADFGESTTEIADDVPAMQREMTDETEPDVIEIEPVSVVDTTAELLGRAKPRAPRTRAGRTGVAGAPASPAPRGRSGVGAGAGGARKAVAKKPAPVKRAAAGRARKPAGNKDDDNFGNR